MHRIKNAEDAALSKNVSLNKKNYYVVCPSNAVTGGPDALHQMVFYMTKLGMNCKIAYMADDIKKIQIPTPYKIYLEEFCLFKDIPDKSDTTVIVPESRSYLTKYFSSAFVFIWWLSVDNNRIDQNIFKKLFFCITFPFRVFKHKQLYKGSVISKLKDTLLVEEYSFDNEPNNVGHLCASYYALDVVGKKSTKQVYKCIEPISYIFLERYRKDRFDNNRNNIIIYNPKKSGSVIDKIKEKYSFLQFKPLINMSQEEMILAYKKAKLYIDFGPFPGAERIPKEAVLYGCLIITGKHGASFYHGDVPIPDEYKFDESKDIDKIVEKIEYCLKNYEICYADFEEYRDTVKKLENNFQCSLVDIFMD